jgi:phosphoglycolate phosphatase-like HAD superfamily hydrolase
MKYKLVAMDMDGTLLNSKRSITVDTLFAIKDAMKKGVKFTIKCFNLAIKLQSVITPIYWIKKGTKDFSISSLLQFLIKCLFEVVGKETANIYNESFKNF